jgi:hypothetical protein
MSEVTELYDLFPAEFGATVAAGLKMVDVMVNW